MSILHTISKAPSIGLLEQCLSALQPNDALLFIEDGIYHCNEKQLLDQVDNGVPIFFLKEDLSARGLQERVGNSGEPVSYRRFVELCVKHDKVISWF